MQPKVDADRKATTAEEERKKLLHFAIVGGGPTGIEFAAELHDLIHDDLSKMYANLLPYVQITVYDVAPKILPMFDQALASYAMKTFSRQKIDVKTAHSIQRVRPDPDGCGGLQLKIKEYNGGEVGAGMVVWSTGLMQNPLIEKLVHKGVRTPDTGDQDFHLEKDRRTGGVVVDGQLRAHIIDAAAAEAAAKLPPGPPPPAHKAGDPPAPPARILKDVFVIGDCAVVDDQRMLPKTAQVAAQQAAYLSKSLNAGGSPSANAAPFAFRNLGVMTYLGQWRALWQKDSSDLTGRAAWVLWRTAYLTRSMSIKNKVLIPFYVSIVSSPLLLLYAISLAGSASGRDFDRNIHPSFVSSS